MRVGFLGGSFDPIHDGHLKLAAAARRQLKLDRVYFLLSPRSPFKLHRRSTAVSDRLRMLRLALRKHPGFQPGLWELRRKGPAYTIDTLRAYRKKHPSHELIFIIGSDNISGLKRWKNIRGVLSLAQFAVGVRSGHRRAIPARFLNRPLLKLRGVFPRVSSTAVRQGKSSRIPAVVRRYVSARKIYD